MIVPISDGDRSEMEDNPDQQYAVPIPDETARHDNREIREQIQQQLSDQADSLSADEEEDRCNQFRSKNKITLENDEDSEDKSRNRRGD